MSATLLILLLLGQGGSGSVPAALGARSSGTERDIVVTATPLEQTERAWKGCRVRRCPPDQEISAAIAHAENLFIAGRYRQARSVLYRTVERTRSAAGQYPIAVSDLRRTHARVLIHMGEDVEARRGMLASRDVLAVGLGKGDPRALAQRLLVADAIMLQDPRPRFNGITVVLEDDRKVALRTYGAVARDAHRFDLPDLEGRALIRIAALLIGFASANPRDYDGPAREAIGRIAATTDPRLAGYREAAAVLAARMDVARGDASVDQLVAAYKGGPARVPVLLYAPPIDWSRSRDLQQSVSRAVLAQIGSGQAGAGQGAAIGDRGRIDEWVDIGFRIGPDGRVEDVDTLRQSAERRSDWVAPVLAAVGARRYAPLVPGMASQRRVERHTYTAGWITPTGTAIRVQIGRPRVVVLDMTNEPAAAEAGSPVQPSSG